MKTFFKSVPLPMCGLILAILSLGNLFITYNLTLIGEIISVLGVILMTLILAKVIFVFEHIRKDLRNNMVASTAPTFTMGAMVICTDLVRWFPESDFVKYIWLFLIALQIVLIIYFTYTFLIAPEVKMSHIYPSWFVIYCGLGIVPITCAQFYPSLGRFIFWSALIFYAVLLPVVIYRVFIHRRFEEHEMPVITIMAAPGSLCLTGYLAAFPDANFTLVTTLVVISQFLYLGILIALPKLMKGAFYPSYAAFTFPLVICSTALQKTYAYYTDLGYNVEFMNYIAMAEATLATIVVAYVLFKYIEHIITATNKHNAPHTELNDLMD